MVIFLIQENSFDMISIIVCHRDEDYLTSFKANVAKTIGLPYEIVVVDNKAGNWGICGAYNYGAKQAVFSILLFVHEDVLFHTDNWGHALLKHFEDPSVGVIGIAGSQFFGKKGFSWGGKMGLGRLQILQHVANKNPQKLLVNPQNEVFSRVVAVDGVFIGTRKAVWEENPFDEVNLKGFHCYDLDYSLTASLKYQVLVVFDILLEHFSKATYTQVFMDQYAIFKNKWKDKLPQFIPTFNPKLIPIAEWQMFIYTSPYYEKTLASFFFLIWDALKLFMVYPRPFQFSKAIYFILRGRLLNLKRS